MATMEELRSLYEAYDEKAKKVRSKASRFAGAFNLGDDPRRHECHEDFYDDVGAWTTEFLQGEPGPEMTCEAVRWILEAADANRDTDVYWHMYAAQSHAKLLIPRLSAEDSRRLLLWYDETYPALDRLPAQQEVYKLLKKQAGETGGKVRWFGFLNRKK